MSRIVSIDDLITELKATKKAMERVGLSHYWTPHLDTFTDVVLPQVRNRLEEESPTVVVS